MEDKHILYIYVSLGQYSFQFVFVWLHLPVITMFSCGMKIAAETFTQSYANIFCDIRYSKFYLFTTPTSSLDLFILNHVIQVLNFQSDISNGEINL